MRPKMKRENLLNKDDIWNAVTSVLSEHDLSTENNKTDETFLAFQYYSEMESGGHESLLNSLEWYIEEIGIDHYLKNLIGVLEKIEAYDYAAIVKNNCEELWTLYIALENDEIEEEKFYHLIEKADTDYHKLGDQLETLLEAYFVTIHTELIEVVED